MGEPSDEMLEDAKQIRAHIEERAMRIYLAHQRLAYGYLDAGTLVLFKRGSWIKGITYTASSMDN